LVKSQGVSGCSSPVERSYGVREAKGATPFTPTIKYKKFETDKARLNYVEAGSGRFLLLLHGIGVKSTTYRKLISILAQNFRVIAPNLHFSINNEPVSETKTYVNLLTNFIDDRKLKNIIVLGHSFGGGIALNLAQKNKNITNLILCGSTGLASPDSMRKLMYKFFILKTWNSIKEGKFSIMTRIAADFCLVCAPALFKFGKVRRIINKINYTDQVPKGDIEAEVLLIWGDKDELYSPEYARKLQKRLHNSKLIFIPGNHDVLLYEAEKFGKLMTDNFN